MKKRSKVYIAIGSNLGNKLQYLQKSLVYITNEIGTIVKISPIFETPAWGFEGADFYNACIAVQTFEPAQVVLQKLLHIETELGRTRAGGDGYQSRTIDLDILFYDDEVIDTTDLQLPHPQLHLRNFVLAPLAAIAPGKVHPIFKKSVLELLEQSPDAGVCKNVGYLLEDPKRKQLFANYNYIAIEGNIGAGKTTLATKISEDFNAKLILERFADNPFLPKFYEDNARYAFPLEMSFLADRYQQISDDLAQFDLFKDFVVSDYDVFKSLIFAKVTLQQEEFSLYRKLFTIMHKEMIKPDLYIYLHQNTERLLANIKKRGRMYEQKIPASYLEKINEGYTEFMRSKNEHNVLVIDVSDKDFVANPEDYEAILDQIANF
ncbi:2-amino-4-hydroxy-6-hydroxymethyldihydropteridine diphosphokinase [Neptunitalea lumnitzerae]|uniref:2-amino-4-hydroxy-6-hydroxymethyldihydropteridine pyrophosphokinase n=1 Tax=Neptunitalea lumnitzerae TaxID=2965509 RepID=A0ABQ5MHX1_9FLAO|nr:2-amino-4-hydroxy-6-hydroxymethyldihydropteridine diphosphokinase [Neptunitalea sp. Y10]GLB48988.1 2-amino-4-hydroxy-6-hydroxymethyldihydropteridine diphosphokinase [Neptunitalea sp. Y10]